MVPAAGVEPATFRSGGERSNPLSYAGLNKIAGFNELERECPPFCNPFWTTRQYRAALGFTNGSQVRPPLRLPEYNTSVILELPFLLMNKEPCPQSRAALAHSAFF